MSRFLAALLVLGLGPAAAAQPMTTDAPPVAGTLRPDRGTADLSFDVRPSRDAAASEDCSVYPFPSAPDAVVDWDGGDLQLWVRAEFDATLAVYRPDGTWACDDDTRGLLPVVRLPDAPAGRYVVWLGSYAETPEAPRATLYAGEPPPAPVLVADARPAAGTIRADGGFEASQGTVHVSVRAGGLDAMSEVDLSGTPDAPVFCSGHVDAARPTAAIDYDADGGTGSLGIRAAASDDLVLVVQTPGGEILCNDDADGSDPAIGVERAASGTYAVWVGTYGPVGEPVGAMLSVSEDAPRAVDGSVVEAEPYSEGTYLALDLEAVPAVRVRARDGEAGEAEVTVRPETPVPVAGPDCRGSVEARATAAIELDGDGPFALTARSDTDATLTVRTPSGDWLCSDDADGLDPGIQIDAPEAGRYLVWVGAFVEPGHVVSATLAATAGEVVVSQPLVGDYGSLRQSAGTYRGTEIRAGDAAAAFDWDAAATRTETVRAGGAVTNPVMGEACSGFVSERPSAEVEAPGSFVVSASGDDDLTLVVLAPDGTWTCSDDGDGTDPLAEVIGGPGTYSIWVGTYYRQDEPTPATLRLERLPASRSTPELPPAIRG